MKLTVYSLLRHWDMNSHLCCRHCQLIFNKEQKVGKEMREWERKKERRKQTDEQLGRHRYRWLMPSILLAFWVVFGKPTFLKHRRQFLGNPWHFTSATFGISPRSLSLMGTYSVSFINAIFSAVSWYLFRHLTIYTYSGWLCISIGILDEKEHYNKHFRVIRPAIPM